jgi:leucyl/phenylalanyl-tRNA--protein transferase
VRLNPEILESCYRAGAFPMADRYGRIQFYRSDPRAILELDSLHVSKSLRRVIHKGVYEVRVDRTSRV